MANTFSQITIHLVFAVKGRQRLIFPDRKEELQKYITGIVRNQGQKLIAIHCMPDHSHILIGLRPSKCLSDLVREIKTGSADHINKNSWVREHFAWQEGFGAFSYAHDDLPNVIRYIENQEEHHKKRTFREEFLACLKEFEMTVDERYLFEEP